MKLFVKKFWMYCKYRNLDEKETFYDSMTTRLLSIDISSCGFDVDISLKNIYFKKFSELHVQMLCIAVFPQQPDVCFELD